jgi:hypothetical protein
MLHICMIKAGVGPFNLRNILLQNMPIENMKPKAQMRNH